LKDVKLKLISELIKNSRRSDRELAKAVGVSQPTVSRLIKQLEKDGIIKEYTIIPDYVKLGYKVAAMTLVKLKEGLGEKDVLEARKVAQKDFEKAPTEIIMFERGIGHGFTGVIVSLHKDYSAYNKLITMTKQYPFVDHTATINFLIDLEDKIHYRPLTFRTLAENLLTLEEKEN